MRAIGKNIIIKKIEGEVKTSSGLLLSAEDTSDFRYQRGEIVLPGTDVTHISKGDIVYYDSRQAYTLVIKEETVTIIQEHAIVVVE